MRIKSYLSKYPQLKLIILLIYLIANFAFFNPLVLAVPDANQNIYNWSYQGNRNPNLWGKISSEFTLCELGTQQSPINLNHPQNHKNANLEFHYQPSPLSVIDTGNSIQVNYQPGSNINLNGEKYELLQFHFHTPSEHQINSQTSVMEMHLVHRSKKGKLAVIGVMIEEGKFNPDIEKIILYPSKENHNSVINANNLLPEQKAYFSYDGSLTTPPCSENVNWNILQQPIQLSANQIQFFYSIYQMNARPIQPVNNRTIDFYS